MNNKEFLLERYAANLSNSDNRAHYLRYARAYLDQADGMDKASIDSFMAALRKQGRKPGTINFAFRVVRRLFAVNGLPWEYRQGEAPTIGQREEYRPQLSDEIIRAMIEAALSGRLYPEESCFLSLSTIFGLRREEMVTIFTEDVDLQNKSIYIKTVKFGRQRYHLIPPEILPYMATHDFSHIYALATMTKIFKKIMVKSGMESLKQERLGWHSIRRALIDGLINNGVNTMALRSFLRWKSASGEMAMPARYYGNVVIHLNGSKPQLDEARGDEEIFEKHPFIPYWRGQWRLNV